MPTRFRTGYLKEDFTKEGGLKKNAKRWVDVTIEYLPCGHMNNLNKPDRESGKCPKGCGTFEVSRPKEA